MGRRGLWGCCLWTRALGSPVCVWDHSLWVSPPHLVADPVAPQPHTLSGSGREEQLMLVLMSCPTPHQQEKCHQYWPAERSARYQYFVVDPMAEYNMPQYILREFKVTDARVSASAGSSAPLLPLPLPYPGQSREHATVPGEIGKQILPCTAGKKSCCPPPTAPLSKGSCPDSCVSPMSSSGIPVSTRSCLACAAHLVKHLTQSPCTWTMCVQHLTRHRTFVLQ